jgi:hypothetical protein
VFLFSYFRTESEALHLAISEDGFTFDSVNGNRPVLEGTANTRTLRDPFLIQAEKGVFHLLATDGWGSTSIIHARSDDLISWSAQTALPVMADVPDTRNSWAPEAFYDKEGGLYRLIWSSTVSAVFPEKVKDHRIWACETKDFQTFSESHLFFDPGYNVIDATVAPLGDAYLMVFKDERGENRKGTEYKALRTAMSLRGIGPFESVSDLISPSLVEGPTLYQKDGLWILLYDHFHDHHYGASLSEDGREWQVSEVEVILPEDPRHGSVIEIDDEVAHRLKRHFG